VFWVSFALLLLFPTFVAAYPFALSCFVALCFALLCFPLHLQNQFLSITLVPILIIPFSLSLSLSLSLSTFVSFFLLLQKFVFYVSFCGKIRAKFCFANFDRNPKLKGKGKGTKTKQRSSRERVCLLLLVDALFFFFGWRFFFSKKKWVLLHFSCFTKFLAQNCHP
jgi:hypothetical protein